MRNEKYFLPLGAECPSYATDLIIFIIVCNLEIKKNANISTAYSLGGQLLQKRKRILIKVECNTKTLFFLVKFNIFFVCWISYKMQQQNALYLCYLLLANKNKTSHTLTSLWQTVMFVLMPEHSHTQNAIIFRGTTRFHV